MASTPSKTYDGWTGRRIDFQAFAADISRRRAETGIVDLPRNSGKRRTASKKALLAAIEAAGGEVVSLHAPHADAKRIKIWLGVNVIAFFKPVLSSAEGARGYQTAIYAALRGVGFR